MDTLMVNAQIVQAMWAWNTGQASYDDTLTQLTASGVSLVDAVRRLAQTTRFVWVLAPSQM